MTIVRLALLGFMAVLVVRQILGRSPDPIRQAHGGRDPLAGVLQPADASAGGQTTESARTEPQRTEPARTEPQRTKPQSAEPVRENGNGSGGEVGVQKKESNDG